MGERSSTSNGVAANPCLTMHQPWASLLVHGIKRIEGRNWPTPLRGCLWIHAASKVPDGETIKSMEDFYREIYAVDGIRNLKFPDQYPVSKLLGCVEVVGCVKCEELTSWEEVSEGVRLEGMTKFVWLCEQPQMLLDPVHMRGNQGVYDLEGKIYEAAVRALSLVEAPLPVKFPLPDPRDRLSLKPGSLISNSSGSKESEVEKSPSLMAAIAGARAAATQFSKRGQKPTYLVQQNIISDSSLRQQHNNTRTVMDSNSDGIFQRPPHRNLVNNYKVKSQDISYRGNNKKIYQAQRDLNLHVGTTYTVEDRKSDARSSIYPGPQRRDQVHNYNDQSRETNYRGKSHQMHQGTQRESNLQAGLTYNTGGRRKSDASFYRKLPERNPSHNYGEQSQETDYREHNNGISEAPQPNLNPLTGATTKIFAAAMRGLRLE